MLQPGSSDRREREWLLRVGGTNLVEEVDSALYFHSIWILTSVPLFMPSPVGKPPHIVRLLGSWRGLPCVRWVSLAKGARKPNLKGPRLQKSFE